MIFDDLFYPGNPGRRQEVANLRGEIIAIIKNYKGAWNENAELLNKIFKEVKNPTYAGITFLKLQKNIESDTIGDCIKEINDVLTDSKTKLDKLVTDIGLSQILPEDWKENGCNIEQIGTDNILKIGRIVSGLESSAAAAFVGYYVFNGVTVAVSLLAAITGTVTSTLALCGGALAGAILGGAAFIISDMIASAITGAIERKELNSAIDSLKKIKDAIDPNLTEATTKLSGITQSIKDGLYRLDDKNILIKDSKGNYMIIEINTTNSQLSRGVSKEGILFLNA